MTLRVARVRSTERFAAELRGAGPDVQSAAKSAIDRLLASPQSRSLRLHALSGYGKPTVYKIDVMSNRAWQITFELDGDTAILRRIARHKDLDRSLR